MQLAQGDLQAVAMAVEGDEISPRCPLLTAADDGEGRLSGLAASTTAVCTLTCTQHTHQSVLNQPDTLTCNAANDEDRYS